MSVKRIIQLPTASGVAPGVTSTFDIPVGPRYHVLWVKGTSTNYGGDIADIFGDIRIKVNGKVQRTFHGAELDAINKLMGAEYAAKQLPAIGPGVTVSGFIIPIFFAEPWRKMPITGDALAWSTGDLATLQIEIEIGGAAASPRVDGWVELDNSIVKSGNVDVQAPMGIICKWNRTEVPVNGTTQDIQTFPRRDFYQQLSFIDPAITKIEIKVEGFVIREIEKVVNDLILVSRGMVPVAGRFDVVFDHDDILDSALPMVVGGRAVQDFQVKLTLSDPTPRNIRCVYQVIGRPE